MEKSESSQAVINNDFYEQLHDSWYTSSDHAIAFLRCENKLRAPWICEKITNYFGKAKVLDIGCGAGFLTNFLAKHGHDVTGIDISPSSLDIAKKYDTTKSVRYLHADACHLPLNDASFDAIFAMDILEHVQAPQALIQEASRCLKKNGLFFFHTFNRNLLSYLLIIKGAEWLVKNTPPNLHAYSLFITPKELQNMCEKNNLFIQEIRGFTPKIFQKPMWKLITSRVVPEDFRFQFSRSLATGYCGIAVKN